MFQLVLPLHVCTNPAAAESTVEPLRSIVDSAAAEPLHSIDDSTAARVALTETS
jgi:hypothetical protein